MTWNHGAATGTPLSPAHRALACDSCHTNRRFDAGSPSCYSCHAKQYQSDHAAVASRRPGSRPSASCATSRRTPRSRRPSFQHNAYFPLGGVHATQACAACHSNNVYKGTPRDCVGCHRTDYERTTSPNHAAAGFPTDVRVVPPRRRTRAGRRRSITAASTRSSGVHATQPCSACHKNNVYKGTPRDCVGCHRDQLRRARRARTTRPPASRPRASRATGPRTRAGSATFNHNAVFPLVGVHATQACTACHKNNVYKGTPRDCFGCHRTDYERTTSPNHAAAGFPTACDSCHSASVVDLVGELRPQPVLRAGRPPPDGVVHVRATRTTSTGARRATAIPCHQAKYDAHDEPEPPCGGVPDDVRDVSQEHRLVVQPGPVQPHVVPDHVRQARRPRVRGVPSGSEQLQGVHLHDAATPRTKMDSEHAGRPGTATTRPPATRATRRGRARRPPMTPRLIDC